MTDRINRAILTLSACAALALAAAPAHAQNGEDAEAAAEGVEAGAQEAAEAAEAQDDAETSVDDDAAENGEEDLDAEDDVDDDGPENGDGEEHDEAEARTTVDSGIQPETEDMDVDDEAVEREIETRVAVDVHPEPTVFITGNAEAKDDENKVFPGWRIGLTGFIRTQYTAIEDDPGTNFGRNDGFALADARLGLIGESKDGIGFKLEIDAGTARPTGDANDPVGEVVTRLTDGYLYYAPHTLLRVSAGQFKPPFDLEELISTSAILFIERSVGSRGVQNIEGPNREGLSRTREVGLRVDSAPYYFMADDPEDPEGLGVSYGLAVTNGQTVNQTFNDNDQLAYTGRATLHWDEYVQIGGGAYQNDRTLGAPPDQIGETRFGWTADVLAQAYGAVVFASIIQTDIEPAAELSGQQSRTARAFQAQVGYRDPIIGIGPTYRFAHYDGDIDVDGENGPRQYEALTYHTVGIIADPWDFPIRFLAHYTITEEEVNPVKNNRFDAVIQLAW